MSKLKIVVSSPFKWIQLDEITSKYDIVQIPKNEVKERFKDEMKEASGLITIGQPPVDQSVTKN